jgi:uncharacterized phage protein gp47/JayE
MAFERPSITQLVERIQSDIETRLPGSDARLRRSLLEVLARTHAGAVHGLYGHLDWLSRQLMIDTADAEHLARWASIWGVARTASTAATGEVTCAGTDGAVIPAGTVLQAADGTAYSTDADATIAAGSASLNVTAQSPGAAGDLAAGSSLSLVSPISGVQSQASVAAGGLTGGADIESDDALRMRLLDRIHQPPQGGAGYDYTAWARAAHPDVTDVWVAPLELGLGTVTVRVMTYDATADGLPQQSVLDAVQAYIDERRPVTADVSVAAPIAVPLDFTIALTPSSAAVQQAVQAELTDLLRRAASPGGTILRSHITEAISTAAGETDHTLTAPAADVAHGTGEIAVMGAITWA